MRLPPHKSLLKFLIIFSQKKQGEAPLRPAEFLASLLMFAVLFASFV